MSLNEPRIDLLHLLHFCHLLISRTSHGVRAKYCLAIVATRYLCSQQQETYFRDRKSLPRVGKPTWQLRPSFRGRTPLAEAGKLPPRGRSIPSPSLRPSPRGWKHLSPAESLSRSQNTFFPSLKTNSSLWQKSRCFLCYSTEFRGEHVL